jgi:excisionase family DNA binding protein
MGVFTVTTEWLTANEAAAYLKVKPRTVLKWAKEGTIPAHSLSGSKRVTWRFLKSELDAMLSPPSAAGDGGLNAAQQN